MALRDLRATPRRQDRRSYAPASVFLLLIVSQAPGNHVFAGMSSRGSKSMTLTAAPSTPSSHGTAGLVQSSLPTRASSRGARAGAGATPDTEKARQLISHAEGGSSKSGHLKLASDEAEHNGVVTLITGPSRQGKSHMSNMLVGREAFGVSDHPMDPQTFGAWFAETDTGDLIVDTEGQSHSVEDATIRLFSMIYPISQNLVWSDKTVGDDRFFAMFEELAAKMEGFKDSVEAKKPRLIYVARDYGSTIDFNKLVQEKIAPRLMKLRLFSAVRGVAFEENLQKYNPGTSEAKHAISDLRAVLQEEHPGPLMDVRDKKEMLVLLKVVNEQGVFRPHDMANVLLANLGPYQDANSGNAHDRQKLAERFDFDPGAMMSEFFKAQERVTDLCSKFPQMNDVRSSLRTLRNNMEKLEQEMQKKVPIMEMVPVRRVRQGRGSFDVDAGGHHVEGGVVGGTAGAVGATLGKAKGLEVVATSAVSGFLGACIGCAKRKKATVELPTAVEYVEDVPQQKGWKLPDRVPVANATHK